MLKFTYLGAVNYTKDVESNGRVYHNAYFADGKGFSISEGITLEKGKIYRCEGVGNFGRKKTGENWHQFTITSAVEVQ